MSPESFLRLVGARVRKARWLVGLTQEQVAERSGVHARHYQELERGEINASLRTLIKLSNVLGRSVAELVDVESARKGRGTTPLGEAVATPPKRGRKAKPKPRTRK